MTQTATKQQSANYGISPEHVLFLRQFVECESGIVLGEGKEYLLHTRLTPLVSQLQLSSIAELCDQMRTNGNARLRQNVVEAITTHETLFFRDLPVFDSIRAKILPEIASRRCTTKTIRVWSAACSSGQEAYSVAMLALEAGYGDWNFQIFGTDLSSKIVERARAACYLKIEVSRGLPSAYLEKYFDKCAAGWRIKEPLRRMVSFSTFDLRNDARTLGPFDIVLCRNVLIYFNADTRKKVLRGIRGTMSAGAYLLLGSSESTFGIDQSYLRKDLCDTVAYQKPL